MRMVRIISAFIISTPDDKGSQNQDEASGHRQQGLTYDILQQLHQTPKWSWIHASLIGVTASPSIT